MAAEQLTAEKREERTVIVLDLAAKLPSPS
jgi:hypothetical protein